MITYKWSTNKQQSTPFVQDIELNYCSKISNVILTYQEDNNYFIEITINIILHMTSYL